MLGVFFSQLSLGGSTPVQSFMLASKTERFWWISGICRSTTCFYLVLTFLEASATVERSFSVMRHAKSHLRRQWLTVGLAVGDRH